MVAIRRVSVDRGPLGSLIGGMTRTSRVLRDRTTLAVMSKPVGPYTPIVRGGDLLFTAGQVGIADGAIVEGGLAAELRQVFVNLRSVLSSADASLNDVVKTTVFLTDMGDYAAMNEIYMEEFGDHRPARSAVAVKELPLGAKIEIEAIAAA